MNDTRPEWLGEAKCVVSLTFDNFGDSYDVLRYGHAGGASADGVYAPRRGVPRILDFLERHEIPATFFIEGWNAQKYAPLAREIVDRGHEVGGHGWMHETWNELSRVKERDLILRSTDAITQATGIRPTGWRAPAGLTTVDTLSLLHDAGYGYDSSFGDDDFPYRMTVAPDRRDTLIELPWTWTLDDAAYYKYPGVIRRPDEVIDIWIDEFDAAYEMTGYFAVVCHPRYSGRPARLRALERLVEHIKQHDGVWFARCQDIADAARESTSIPSYPAPARW